MNNKFFLYRHIRLDKNIPFYIGIGTVQNQFDLYSKQYGRAFTKYGRNKFWHNIINKTDYEVEIIFETKNKKLILEKEKEFIKLYGRKDLNLGFLVNHTNGGEFNKGRIMSNETKEKISNYWKEHIHPLKGKPGKNNGGFKGKHTPEALKKISKHSHGWNHPQCKLNKEQVIEIQEAWKNKKEKITKLNFCKPFEIKFKVKYRVIYNALKYNISCT